jgi:hypothetical protein
MTGIAGQLAGASANTEYKNYGQEIFNRPMGGPFSLYTQILPCDGRALELDAIGPSSEAEEMLGSRVWTGFRQYAKRVEVKPYSIKGASLRRDLVDKDPTGAMAARLRDFLDGARDFWDKPVTDVLLSNPTGIDGVALLSASHPHGPDGGTWDNITTGTLSQTELKTGWVAMTSLRNERGAPMGIMPTHLMVGPKYYREALDLTGSARPVPISTAGAVDATSTVQSAVLQENWLKGQLQVILNPRMVGTTYEDDWFLMDLSKSVRPIVAGEAIAPEAFVATSADSAGMQNLSQYRYWVEGYAAIGGGVPHVIYGRRGG